MLSVPLPFGRPQAHSEHANWHLVKGRANAPKRVRTSEMEGRAGIGQKPVQAPQGSEVRNEEWMGHNHTWFSPSDVPPASVSPRTQNADPQAHLTCGGHSALG